MSSYSFTDLRDKVLLWSHGRRLGVRGDGQGAISAPPTGALVLDGVAIGSTRSGPNSLKVVAAGSNGAGAVTVTGTKVGDNVELVLDLTDATDITTAFEATVSIAGQVQQTSATNYSGKTCVFFVQPQS
jgi:hypothetical protein